MSFDIVQELFFAIARVTAAFWCLTLKLLRLDILLAFTIMILYRAYRLRAKPQQDQRSSCVHIRMIQLFFR